MPANANSQPYSQVPLRDLSFSRPSSSVSPALRQLRTGVGATLFDQMVADGRMPKPKLINSRKVWDRHQLDAEFAALPEEGQDKESSNPWWDCA